MKQFFILVILTFGCLISFAQGNVVKVTLKNGTSITGELVELKPSDHVTIRIAGITSNMDMSEISSIEEAAYLQKTTLNAPPTNQKLILGEFEITDMQEYPDSIIIKLGEQELMMVLVRGGWFNMGFEGRHSWAMASEPIHKVTLSSFYISTDVLDDYEGNRLNGKIKGNHNRPFKTDDWSTANRILIKLQNEIDIPVRMPTEAEWEYSAIMPFANRIFGKDKYLEWCSDFFNKEYPESSQVNPTGPKDGKIHVRRSFNLGRGIWERFRVNDRTGDEYGIQYYDTCIRLVVSANSIITDNDR